MSKNTRKRTVVYQNTRIDWATGVAIVALTLVIAILISAEERSAEIRQETIRQEGIVK